MSEGNVTRRGKRSWRLKFELPRAADGERRTGYLTVKGSRQDAEKELRRRLTAIDKGVAVEPRSLTVRDYLKQWLAQVAVRTCGAKARHRYGQLIAIQITPRLGEIELQKLKPAHVDTWLQALDGKVSARTIRHAFSVLRVALNHAVAVELVERNVCTVVKPPRQARQEVEILAADEIGEVLARLAGYWLHPIAVLAFGTGARRGELCGLRWSDWQSGSLRIERAIEQVGRTVTIKAPKTKAGIRTVTLPAYCIEVLRAHRKAQLEQCLALGFGKLPDDAAIFVNPLTGKALQPDAISCAWTKRKLGVSFHSLRHSHASALISAGLDAVNVSKRLGHASPAVTLSIYSHLFKNRDSEAAKAIDAVLSAPGATR
jgi:integrase